MQAIDLGQLDDLLHGHVGLRRLSDAVQPVRLPPDELPLYDPFLRWMGSMTAGIRMRLCTDSRMLRLTTTQRQVFIIRPNQWPSVYEVFVDGKPWSRPIAAGGAQRSPEGPLIGDEHAVLAIEGLPAGEKRLEVWFPQGATIAIQKVEIGDGASLAPWPDDRPLFIFHGSSITHGAEIEGGTGSWPSVAAALAGAQAVNLGYAGSCLMSGLAARIIRDHPAARIVLELGINVWSMGQLKERTFRDNAHTMLAIIRERHRQTPLIVVSPIFSLAREHYGEEGGLSLTVMRGLLEHVVAERIAIGDRQIGYLSGLDLLGPTEGQSLPDGLHPSIPAYRRIGERFFAKVLAPEHRPV